MEDSRDQQGIRQSKQKRSQEESMRWENTVQSQEGEKREGRKGLSGDAGESVSDAMADNRDKLIQVSGRSQ